MKRIAKSIGLLFVMVLLCSFAVVNAVALDADASLVVDDYALIVDGAVDSTAITNAESEKIYYDEETQTLTLKNYRGGAISAKNLGELNLVLYGSNIVESGENENAIYLLNTDLIVEASTVGSVGITSGAEGIFCESSIDSERNHSIIIYSGRVAMTAVETYYDAADATEYDAGGVSASGAVYIFGGTLKVTSASNAVDCQDFYVKEGTVQLESRSGTGIYCDYFYNENGDVTIYGGDSGIYANENITMCDGTLDVESHHAETLVSMGTIDFYGGDTVLSSTMSAAIIVLNDTYIADAIGLYNPEVIPNSLYGNEIQKTTFESDNTTWYLTTIGKAGFSFDLEEMKYYNSAKEASITQVYPYLSEFEDGWYACDDGYYFTDYTGFAKNEYGTWYFEDGVLSFDVDDVIYDELDDTWKYTRGSKADYGYTGIAKNSNGWWRVEDGIVNFDATGVFKNELGWWYCKDGKVQFNYTGIQKNDLGWWRIVGGKVDFSATGVYQNELGWWYCENGKVNFNYTGIKNNSYGWWRIENGKVNFSATGVYQNELGWWYCKDGKVDFNFTGIGHNSNGSWYCKNGKVDFSKNGRVYYSGKYYTVKGGKVV